MSAKAVYGVRIVFEIIRWEGEWDNNEAQMEPQSTLVAVSQSKEYAEAVFQRMSREAACPKTN